METKFSHTQAQTMLLAAQGLDRRPANPPDKNAVLEIIRQMGVLQIDTIHVVARSPYLVLWSRLGDYEPKWLDELLAEGALFEHWSHEASFLPIEDYALYRRFMLDVYGRSRSWVLTNPEEANQILDRVRELGAVRSADFVRKDGQKGGWWNWKPEKRALEMLHTTGELMIASRHNFHRIYDLRERVLPGWDDKDAPSLEEVHRRLALKAVQSLGLTTAAWVTDYYRQRKVNAAKLLEDFVNKGEVVQVEVEGWKSPAYIHQANLPLAEKVLSGEIKAELTTLLSPFDPIVWDRKRAKALFDFDYRIECYTPAEKRVYGYFTLPILWKNQIIGRLDPKAHRKEKIFEVKNLHLEPGVVITDELLADLCQTLQECANWHKTPQVVIRQSDPPELAELLAKRLT